MICLCKWTCLLGAGLKECLLLQSKPVKQTPPGRKIDFSASITAPQYTVQSVPFLKAASNLLPQICCGCHL